MTTQRWAAKDIQGFNPAIESRRSPNIFAISGKNFVFDSLGPKSIFGDDILTPTTIQPGAWSQGVRLKLRNGDRVINFFPDAIAEWDEAAGNWNVLYLVPDTTSTPYRWTWGYLNNFVFFCHPRTGILIFDPVTNICKKLDGPGVPSTAIAICVDNGRLCVIDSDWLYWSAPSNGQDFTPTLGGAGTQRISDRVSGYPMMITSYVAGILVWTTGGVMRGEFTGDQFVYRFRALNTEYRLINSFCSAKIDDNTSVIFDERGLFQTKGDAPEPWTPLFNEFLIGYVKRLGLKLEQNVRIEWDELQRLVYVSISQSTYNPVYEMSLVLYPALDKWGIMTRPHQGIFPVLISSGSRAGDYYGFISETGQVRYWRDSGRREIAPSDTSLDLFIPKIEYPPTKLLDSSSTVLGSTAWFDTIHGVGKTRASWYPRDGDTPATNDVTGIDASLSVGLIRFNDLTGSVDEAVEMIQITIGSVLSGPADQPFTDWNLEPTAPPEDWVNLTGTEDWGFEPLNYINHGLKVIGTIDGVTSFVEETPTLVAASTAQRYYACAVTGIWHIVVLTAEIPGERFHLRSIELTGNYAGKLL